MSRFKDEYLPDCLLSYNTVASPRFSTDIAVTDSGAESPSQRWAHPLYAFNIPSAVRDMTTFNALQAHFLVMRGPAYTFPFRNPMDFASVDIAKPGIEPTIANTNQIIGTGNGSKTTFQLIKTYTVGSETYVKNIVHPVVASVVVSLNNVNQSSGWSVSRDTGIITFTSPVGNGVVVRAGFYYDVEVRYEADDSLDLVAASYQAGGYADIPLVETRIC